MTTRQKVGTALIVSGVIAGLGNYLWLVGLVSEPSGDLMAARWVYESLTIVIGAMIGWMPQ